MTPRNFIVHFCCATICIVGAPSLSAETVAQFAKATHEYSQGHYKEAISGYEELARSGQWSATLFYDLGNAYFRAGDFGRAILNYERALALDRHHPESAANLNIARDEARALEIQPRWLERHLLFASLNQYSVTAAAAFWVGIFCVAGLFFARRRPAATIAVSILGFAIFAVSLFAIYRIDNESRGLAIVTGTDVTARLATADNATSILALPAGSEIKILSRRGDWIYATLPNDQRGWIPAAAAEKVRL